MLGVQDYLESLPEAILSKLFRSPSTCLSILRLLPPLAKIIVMQMLFIEQPLSMKYLNQLIKEGHRRQQIEALQTLRKLHVIKEKYASNTIQINKVFSASLRSALMTGSQNSTFGVPCNTPDQSPLTTKELKEISYQRLESILHFMVGGLQFSTSRPPNSVLILLQQSGLMAGPTSERLHITSQGFQFLLQDRSSQIWTLLLHYLSLAQDLNLDTVDVLNFVFMLGNLEIGKSYSLSDLTPTQKKMLEDLGNIGVIYQSGPASDRFYPTPLAAVLTSEEHEGEAAKGFIIIETNYRLYAYTESPLQISILNLFCHLKSRFRNLVVARLTRDSVRRALVNGITAEQIIQYLVSNAHDQMLTDDGPVLAPTISDQIKLWQLELDRFLSVPGFLYRDFSGTKEYNLVASYAQDMGALVWRNDMRRMFFVEEHSNSQVMEYINRQMQTKHRSGN